MFLLQGSRNFYCTGQVFALASSETYPLVPHLGNDNSGGSSHQIYGWVLQDRPALSSSFYPNLRVAWVSRPLSPYSRNNRSLLPPRSVLGTPLFVFQQHRQLSPNKRKMKFKPMVAARDALVVDPGMSGKKLSKVARNIVIEDDSEERLSLLLATNRRGEAMRVAEGKQLLSGQLP